MIPRTVFKCQNLRSVSKAKIFFFHIVLELYTFELLATCRFWTAWSELLDLRTLTSFITDGVRAFTSGCTVPGTDTACFALRWYTIWTLIAGTCGAVAHASVMCTKKKNIPVQNWQLILIHHNSRSGDNRNNAGVSVINAFLSNASRITVKWVPNVLPLSILTATVLQVESLSIPKAEASTTFPKAPWPRVLPGRRKRYLVSGTAIELPVPQVESQTGFPVSNALGVWLKQHVGLWSASCVFRGNV